jgi:hypothetical protein
MKNDIWIGTRVSADTKRRVQEAARQRFLTDSIWLRQVIEESLKGVEPAPGQVCTPDREPSGRKVTFRLLPGDAMLLRERATARRTASATYVSILVRSHLRQLSPLPKDELRAFREQVREMRAIGRNLNQIARALNRGEVKDASVRDDLRMFIKVATAMREATRALLKANTKAWEVGHVPE